ncbi:sensor histidine kinase [Staphylococcus xylosus]|uniref:sensor histidine kinase n=1 Tax=Staphylococcus xylosus TaxID=1288 RepID=UPI0021755B5B|nr:sensor histidine kinase [Staphylococcus xylosus]
MFGMMHIDEVSIRCKARTMLSEAAINKISEVSGQLQMIANLNQANVFIDCPIEEHGEVIVVAEAVPVNCKSLYQGSVVEANVYEKFEPAVFEVLSGSEFAQHRAISQEGKVVEQSATPIKLANEIIGILIMEIDVSNKIMEEKRLKALTQATSTLSDLVSNSESNPIFVPDMIEESLFDLDNDLNIRYFNLAGEAMVSELLHLDCEAGLNFIELFPSIENMLTDGRIITIEERALQGHYFQIKCIQLLEDDVMTGHLILLKDITDLKEKERALISKSVAIGEIHHRVKNNLQTVASLLRLQMRRGLPNGSEKYFQESLNRILSIASVYEVILDESSTDSVNIDKLIKKIGNMIVYNESPNRTIHINYKTDENIHLVSNIAVSIALIANELITNCLTHAFNGQAKGEITVCLSYNAQSELINLNVQDTGKAACEFKQSFGLKIVNTITENDLDGAFRIERNSVGTNARVEFQYKGEN